MSDYICLNPHCSAVFDDTDVVTRNIDDQTDNAMRSITEEQQTRTRLADNYGSYFRFLSQMYGGD